MRDIPKINYNTTQKTKTITNENEATGTLTKNGFRSYKDFLEHYDNNKNNKDDQESVSSVDSGISESKSDSTSTSSLNSDVPLSKIDAFGKVRTGSFRKYMENYNNKKFSSVKPNAINKQNVIKSEIVIQINTPMRIEDVPDFPPPSPPVVNLENSYVTEFLPPPPPLPKELPPSRPPNLFVPPPPLPSSAPPPPPMPLFANVPVKKWTPVQTEIHSAPVKEKTPNSAATNLAAVLTQNALFKRMAHESETKTDNETVTDFRVNDSPKPQKKISVDSQKHIVKPFVNHRTITVEVPLASPPKSLNDVDYDTTTVVPIADKSAKVNTSDPNVKKMVYSTYRGLLGAYNNKANGMIATLPRSMVREDRGVSKQLESITQAAPPPPPGATGHIPTTRLKSEISDRREPPLCVQNAMLTKDKKPFTYTPGGIDLSEIRSPRMARRLERNAMNEGVSSVPQATHHPTGPLPPSALAAMQPQLSVQVFPTGGIPHPPQGGPPPPPPPPKAPPMKTSPLPTDCFNRPDMTKIIPDNPMALLRKTSGPVIKQDPILNKSGGGPPRQTESFNQNNYVPADMQPRSVENKATAAVGSIYVPPINQTKPADSPPASHTPPAYYKRQPSTSQPEPPKPQTPDSPNSPKPTLSKAPTPWLTQRRQLSQDVPEWAVNDQRVQSPPVLQDQVMHQQREESPQAKPVRPWQQQQQQQEVPVRYPQQQPETQQRYHQQEMQPRYQQPDMQQRYQQPQQEVRYPQQQADMQQRYQLQEMQPRYQQRQQEVRNQPDMQQRYQQQPQPFWQEPPRQQPQTPPAGGVRKQIQTKERPQEYYAPERTEVVIVNEPPQIHHHPGQRVITRQSPQQHKHDDGIRIIPVQIEGRSNGQVRSPNQGANSDARSFNRQLSWNSSPTQSNTFRVLQKITQTDGADDDDQVVIEHSPKMHQQFPQRQASLDGRKWNQNDSDQALMGTFKQVPQAQPSNASGPKVRTIPIQIEGNGPTKNYVPPSEQTVQEPKKYMGSSIPSRSFKILQAMTAPDECGPGQSDL